MQLVSATLLLSLLTTVLAARKYFTLDLAYSRQSPDGFAMDMMLANGQIDYPIVVNRGDTVVVTVFNNLNVSTAIHWHGMFQKGTPWMDGAAMVTQCPIQPGDIYVYEFKVGNQVGTYWWHAHFKSQYINGLRGPFIIKDPRDPYLRQYDYDITMTLTDFYHNGSEFLLNNILYNENNTNANEPLPESGLIGGVGRYNCSITQSKNKHCKNNNPLKQYTVIPGKRYRIRLINTAAQARYTFSIDGHNLTVIEQDGVYTDPTV
ncbi:laccase, multicopper oxidase, benzenediol:oxygen oxidorectuctase, partial [Rhizoclosmatium hyalinum]